MNVEWPELQEPKPNETFYEATIDNLHLYGRNFSIMEMDVCAR